jgi:nucleotide-binding universal stress UspA family protein
MKKKTNNVILVPVDFTEAAKNAVNRAVKFGELAGFKVVLLHVINRETKAAMGKEGVEKTVEKKLAALVKEMKKDSKVVIEAIYREGSIFDVIHQVAGELGINIMFLGTHGKRGFQKLFGSYALKVISQSPAPVVVVQKKGLKTKSLARKAVFPVSIHTEARQQVPHTIGFSKFFDEEVLIFRQISKDPVENARLEVITSQIENEFKKHKVKYSVTKAEKYAYYSKQLVEFAVASNADLIFMMTDSRIDHPEFNNSSWSEKIMFNEAQIPVLCINPVYLGEIYFPF